MTTDSFSTPSVLEPARDIESLDGPRVAAGPRYQCPRYQRKWSPEMPPGAIFTPDGNTFGNISVGNGSSTSSGIPHESSCQATSVKAPRRNCRPCRIKVRRWRRHVSTRVRHLLLEPAFNYVGGEIDHAAY
jgi:hypothetical protein